MSNNTIENLLYRAGLTAQGCWDELDQYAQDAILRVITMAAEDCASMCMSQADRKNIRKRFGLPVETNIQYPGPDPHGSITSQYTRQYNLPKD